MFDRRQILATGIATTVSGWLADGSRLLAAQAEPHSHPIAVFTKPLQSMPVEELAKRLKEIGVQGLEATLRKGGQIEPEALAAELPRFCETLAKYDQRVIIATSDVNKVDAAAERYLKTLAKEKIPYLRMAYYRYELTQPILPQLEQFARDAKQLAQLCEAHGVTALYQNHAGAAYVGAALWDLLEVLQDVSPKQMAVAIDLCHTTHELSESWPAAYQAVRRRIGAVFAKDFDWIEGKAINVPLGKGRAKQLWDQLKRDGFAGPISLHMEHIDHRPDELLEDRWRATKVDVEKLKSWLV
jgi:sugar phosphate isomerase/epimerase